MTDKHTLVERLRYHGEDHGNGMLLHAVLFAEAANRITALEAREAELVEALATRVDRVKRCPINRRWLSEADRAKCSKCGATPSESCGETSLADAQFVEIARATLAKARGVA